MTPEIDQDEDRRKFLKACGRFAAVTPPALTVLLSTSLTSDAIARSGGGSGGSDPGGSYHHYDGGGDHNRDGGGDYRHDEGRHYGWSQRGDRD